MDQISLLAFTKDCRLTYLLNKININGFLTNNKIPRRLKQLLHRFIKVELKVTPQSIDQGH